jgi:hypothetical protein
MSQHQALSKFLGKPFVKPKVLDCPLVGSCRFAYSDEWAKPQYDHSVTIDGPEDLIKRMCEVCGYQVFSFTLIGGELDDWLKSKPEKRHELTYQQACERVGRVSLFV